jgi:hypothetical protein
MATSGTFSAAASIASDATSDATSDSDSDDTSWQPTSSSKYKRDDMITFLVGEEEEQQEIIAHGCYLALHSEFFQAALKKEWVEGQTRTIKLPEEDTETMTFYLDFLYGKGLPTDSTKDNSCEGEVYHVLTQLFALGERLLDSSIRNACIKEIVRFTTIASPDVRYFPNDLAVNNIYNSTTAKSPARRLMVDFFVTSGNDKWVNSELHPEFCQDLATEFLAQVKSTTHPCRARKVKAKSYLV